MAFQLIDDLSLPGTQTEAQSWTQSAVVVGVAGGAALAGQLVEAGSPSLALLVGAASVGIGTLVVFLAAATSWSPTPASSGARWCPPTASHTPGRGRPRRPG